MVALPLVVEDYVVAPDTPPVATQQLLVTQELSPVTPGRGGPGLDQSVTISLADPASHAAASSDTATRCASVALSSSPCKRAIEEARDWVARESTTGLSPIPKPHRRIR